MALDQIFSGDSDDFPAVLRRKGLLAATPAVLSGPVAGANVPQTESTTILAFKFRDGVLVAGDRRATSGNIVVYDRADKVLEIDRHSIMAIAGVPATAWEMARVLEHSLQYFRRTQLQEMSVDGKVRALSKLLRDNFGFVMQGVGVVVPIFATYDYGTRPAARLYFYDAMGAQFEATDYCATGFRAHRRCAESSITPIDGAENLCASWTRRKRSRSLCARSIRRPNRTRRPAASIVRDAFFR